MISQYSLNLHIGGYPNEGLPFSLPNVLDCGFPVSFETPMCPASLPLSATPQNFRKQSQKSAELTGNPQPS